MTPEVRLSPDEQNVAIRNGMTEWSPWRVSNGGWYSDAQVSDWTPLLPASSEDGAA
jgi:hypothetical protein